MSLQKNMIKKIGTITDLIHYRLLNERTVEQIESGEINTDFGKFLLYVFKDNTDGETHFALVKGQPNGEDPTLVRVHTGSTVRDMLSAQISEKPNWNIQRCLSHISEEGCGVLVLLASQDNASNWLQDSQIAMGKKKKPLINITKGSDSLTVGVGSQILRHLGIKKMRLMEPEKHYNGLSGLILKWLNMWIVKANN